MFENVGGKIKVVAKVFFGMLAASSAASGIVFLFNKYSWWIGLIIIIGGFLVSWIGSLFLCGFGQLIESVEKLADNSDSGLRQTQNNSTLLKWKEQGLITEEEYRRRIGQ